MNSKERVLAAVAHRETDRLPVFRPNTMDTTEPYDERVVRFLKSFEFDDFAGIGAGLPHPSARREIALGVFEDGFGCRYQYKGVGLPYCVHSPLAAARTVDDIERYAWPEVDVAAPGRSDARERAKATRASGLRATNLGGCQLLHMVQYLRGFGQTFIDMKADPDLFHAIASRVHRINMALLGASLDAVGEFADVVSFGDDFGGTTAPYVSLDDFRALLKPYYAEAFGAVKRRFSHAKVYLHSHGQIMNLVADLVECGVDILNPVLPLDHMDAARLKRDFGGRLTLQGCIDIERIVPFGTLDQVERHVRDVIARLAPGGGFLFKLQVISPLVPPENVIRCYEIATLGKLSLCFDKD